MSPHVVYRKGELSKATIDREWPHQLALSAEYLRGKNCIIVERFCRGLSVCTPHLVDADAGRELALRFLEALRRRAP